MSSTATFDLTGSFELHNIDGGPSTTVEYDKDQLMKQFELMYTMRRMEITCDNEYKARNIRGFCHLYDGQEAVATGIQNALLANDSRNRPSPHQTEDVASIGGNPRVF